VAVRIKRAQSFALVMQMLVMPMFFLSGAFFPVSGLPSWLRVLNRIDPVTYAVDAMRRVVFDHLQMSAQARRTLEPGVTWWGRHPATWLEAAMVLLPGLAIMGAAIASFARTE
jgi:ABC-2 type transport system permease protein